MRRILHWLAIALAIAAIGYFIVTGLAAFREMDFGAFASPANAIALVASALLFFVSYPVSGLAWARMLADFGASQPNRRAVMILSLTQLAKYVPGSVGQPLGRIAMGVRYGIPAVVTVRSMLYESALAALALAMTAIASVAFTGMLQFGVRAADSTRLALSLILVTVLSLASIALIPRLEVWLRRISPSAWAENWPLHGLPKRTAVLCFLAYGFNCLAIGLGFFLVAAAFEPRIQADFLFLTAVFAVSWLAGYVTPGVPAGLGVREGLMVALISPQYGAASAVTIVLAQRLATTLGDLVGFGLGSLLSLLERRDRLLSRPQS